VLWAKLNGPATPSFFLKFSSGCSLRFQQMATHLAKLGGPFGTPVQVPHFGDGNPIHAIRLFDKWMVGRNGKNQTITRAKIGVTGLGEQVLQLVREGPFLTLL
jgi:hypothetical protein